MKTAIIIKEKHVKEWVKDLLNDYKIMNASTTPPWGFEGWYYMPVQNGYGVSRIADFIGHYRGRFFAIETKAPGKKCTGLQERLGLEINQTGAHWVVINDMKDIKQFAEWLNHIKRGVM